ncbi:unnamed protein product [Mytilus edulis]|uniref:Uncharacterized protein n=1 Tax=Mytilus edulis TaxID=6550 RepID=A0A8S3T9L4_MYTED|nr:unnamed protein product [Mytilus edulis]
MKCLQIPDGQNSIEDVIQKLTLRMCVHGENRRKFSEARNGVIYPDFIFGDSFQGNKDYLRFIYRKKDSLPNTKKKPRKVVCTQVLEEKFQCPFCPVKFGNKEDRNRHLIECTDSRLLCELYSYNTNKRADLTRHFKKVHCSTDNKNESEDTESEIDDKKQKPITKSISEDKSKVENNNKKPVCSKPEEAEIIEDTVTLDNSKRLFTDYDDISNDEDDGDEDLELVDKPSEIIVSQPKKPVDEIDESVNMGRIFRNKTDPMPIIAPKKKKTTTVQDLK